MRVHSLDKINEIKKLRRMGYTISELMTRFSVPKTTIWHHIQNVKISSKYLEIWKIKRGGSKNRSLSEWNKAAEAAGKLVSNLSGREKIIVASILYWAEGSKDDFSLSNADPRLIKLFTSCLEEIGIDKSKLAVSIRIYEDIDRKKAVDYWSKIVGITPEKIKSVNILRGKKKGKLQYGMCRIRIIKGGYILKLFQSIHNVLSKNLMPP